MQKFSVIILGLIVGLALIAGGALAIAPPAFADPPTTQVECKDGKKVTAHKNAAKPNNTLDAKDYAVACKKHKGYTAPTDKATGSGKSDDPAPSHTCGGTETYFNFGCGSDEGSSKEGGENNPIVKILASVIKIFTGGVGIVAIAGVVTGGIIYSTAAGNSETTKKGLSFIFNSVLGLALYAFMVAILNFAIPGGLFN